MWVLITGSNGTCSRVYVYTITSLRWRGGGASPLPVLSISFEFFQCGIRYQWFKIFHAFEFTNISVTYDVRQNINFRYNLCFKHEAFDRFHWKPDKVTKILWLKTTGPKQVIKNIYITYIVQFCKIINFKSLWDFNVEVEPLKLENVWYDYKLQQAKNVEMTPSQYLIQNRVQSFRINNNKLDVGNYKPTWSLCFSSWNNGK